MNEENMYEEIHEQKVQMYEEKDNFKYTPTALKTSCTSSTFSTEILYASQTTISDFMATFRQPIWVQNIY